MINLESTRLLLRKFNINDADDCFEFLSDKETCYLDGGYEPWLKKDDAFWNLMNLFESQNSRYMILLKEKTKSLGQYI